MSPGRPSRGPHSTHRREPERPPGRGGPRPDAGKRADPARRAANAVLRRVSERDLAGWLSTVAPSFAADPVGHLALTHSHPEWMVRAFSESLGGDLEQTAEALAADNERPLVHLCARPGRITANELAAEVGGVLGAYSPYAVYLPEGAPGEINALQRGRAHVQDEGSQLMAVALV